MEFNFKREARKDTIVVAGKTTTKETWSNSLSFGWFFVVTLAMIAIITIAIIDTAGVTEFGKWMAEAIGLI